MSLAQFQVQAVDVGLRIASTLVFLLLAGIVIRYISKLVRRASSRKYQEPVIVDLLVDSGKVLMWFWALMIGLSILGFSGIAASMGTATGFIALGVAFALKDVIADTVAGVYLAQDADFNSGDRVSVDGTEGTVENIGLRKTRLRLESGDKRIINNSDVEKKWTLQSTET
jgi:small-conductance mechanosensitive channel